MTAPRAGRWLGWILLATGCAICVGAAILVVTSRPPSGAATAEEDLRGTTEMLRAKIVQALQARAHALEPRATEAANLPELLSGLDLGADAHTFQDLLETEDWWSPFRSELAVSGVVVPSGALAMLGAPLGDPGRLEAVRQARAAGVASGLVVTGGKVFTLGVARVPKGKHRVAGTVVILGAPLDLSVLKSIADETGAAIALADGRRLIGAAGPEPLRAALPAIVAEQPRGAVALEPGRAGALWPLAGDGDGAGGLSAAAVFPIALPPPPPSGPWPALALAGGVLALGGILLLLARKIRELVVARAARGDGAPPRLPPPYENPSGIYPQPSLIAAQPGARPSGTMAVSAVTPGPVSPAGALLARQTRHTDSGASPIVMGRYHLLERVGEGGMAEIFIAATHGVEGFVRHFVVKRMHPHMARNREAVTQFVDEARLQSTLIHSNIVPVFDFGVAGDEYYMALEHIHGRDLDEIVHRHIQKLGRPLSLPVAYYIMHDVLEALAYAHTMVGDDGQPLQIVHRDVSPGNILVSFRGEVKLTDFGIAKASWRVSQTEVGMVKGNTSFMSPEQARGEPVDARSDLFSVGVVLHHCLTGEYLYGGDGAVFKRLMRAAAGPAAADLLQMDKVPPAAAGVLRRALSLDPAQRYQSAREFARDLAGYFTSGRAELSDLMTVLFPERRREPR